MKTLTNEQLTVLVKALAQELAAVYACFCFATGQPEEIPPLTAAIKERFEPLGVDILGPLDEVAP